MKSPLSIASLGEPALAHPPDGKQRLQFVVALRAVASIIILWHHFALYPPLREWAAPLIGGVLDWLEFHARATQVFFVVGGYVMARSMGRQRWNLERLRAFIAQRYYRLGIPYLGAVALVIPAYVVARGWLPDAVVGEPVSLPQLLAHLFFLQDILGYEQLSAGLWFVCINFQLGLVYAFSLLLRDTVGRGKIDVVGLLGWPLAIFSLFYFNLNDAWDSWWLYFFPYFFMGTVIQRSLQGDGFKLEFWLYQLLFVAAMVFEWRWRLLSSFIVGFLLFSSERMGWGLRWPRNRAILWLGNVSYSLFLVHFPMLVLVATLWTRQGWTTPSAAVAGLLVAFGLSLVAAGLFNRWVERPASRLGRVGKREPGMVLAERVQDCRPG
jgi:peptidoglycan/LPS O-acetylase OafA/YrhL